MGGPKQSFVALILATCAASAVVLALRPAAEASQVELRFKEVVHLRGGPAVVVLQEKDGLRRLPIPVSRAEAALIERAVKGGLGLEPQAVDALGGRVLRASIDGISRDRGFKGHVLLGAGSREFRIDGVAGEALSMALQAGAPIVADPSVLDAAAVSPDDLHGRAARELSTDPTPAPVLPI